MIKKYWCICINNKIIGSGWIVCDSGHCLYIQEIMVLKEYHKKEIGSKTVEIFSGF
jgi:hypothetical protein